MTYNDAHAVATSLLARLQRAIDARETAALFDLFDDAAVLIGTGGHNHGRAAVHEYLTAVAEQPGSFRWDWQDVVVFHETPGVVGFAGFGDLVVPDQSGERRAPFRLTALGVESPAGWKLQQFHGSIPSDF